VRPGGRRDPRSTESESSKTGSKRLGRENKGAVRRRPAEREKRDFSCKREAQMTSKGNSAANRQPKVGLTCLKRTQKSADARRCKGFVALIGKKKGKKVLYREGRNEGE